MAHTHTYNALPTVHHSLLTTHWLRPTLLARTYLRYYLLLTEPTNPLQEKAFDALDAPITIVAGRDAPLPYNAALERACIPGADEIVAAALAAMARPGSV